MQNRVTVYGRRNKVSYTTDLGIHATPAVRPPESDGLGRDDVRLLVLDRETGAFQHRHFKSIADTFQPGDVLVVNNSVTIPAALPATVGGALHRLHLAARLDEKQALVELRTWEGGPDGSILAPGTSCVVHDETGAPKSRGRIERHFHPRSRFWVVATESDWYALAPHVGRPIRYHYVDHPYPISTYETLFGRIPGSSEMPSASRPFTKETLHRLRKRGVEIVELTLHTTVSSHEVMDGEVDPPLVPEWFNIPEGTQETVQAARAAGRSVVALGTTVVRALETWSYQGTTRGWTTHLVTPDTPPRLVSGLITGLHDNFTSHLWLLYAFLDPEQLREAYRDAERSGYRWHEFGDLSMIR